MRKILLAGLCLIANFHSVLLAQNKTLGVGVATPSPNAALHVESPTGNQGFIMPRLGTAQREAMISLLTAGDKGLMLYDSDVNTIFIWDGAAWKSSSQFTISDPASAQDGITVLTVGSGSAGKFTVNNASTFSHAVFGENNGDSTSAAVHGNHTGNGFGVFGKSAGSKFASAAVYGEHVGTGDAAGAFRISNAANTYSALFGETNGSGTAVFGNQIGLGRGGQFQITNTANAEAAIRGYTSGTGYAGFYTINNPQNGSAGLFSTTNGLGSAGKFVVNNINSPNPAVWAETNSDQPLSAPVYGLNTGTGDAAGVFRINNAASTFPALVAESNGTGRTATFRKLGTTGGQPAVFIDSQGGSGLWADHNGALGYAAIIQTINTANPNAAMFVETVGTGPSIFAQKSQLTSTGDVVFAEHLGSVGSVANFKIDNVSNTAPVLISSTSGSGPAVLAENTGAADGFAGSFHNSSATNTYPAIQASTAGAGSGVRVMQTTGTGPGMDIFMQNATSTAPGFSASQMGQGSASFFEINNVSSQASSVSATTNGSGFAIHATHKGTTGDAIYAETASTGSAGNFRTSNPDNRASSVYAATNAANGAAIGASNEANGLALAVWGGGMKVSTNDLSTGTSITVRASAYLISGGGPYTFGFIMNEGEIFYIYNNTAAEVFVDKVAIPANSGKTCIFLGAALRAL